MSTLAKARNAYGTTFAIAPSTAGTLVGVGGILSLSGMKFSRGTNDITNWGTSDGYDQVIPAGQFTAAPLTITAVYITSSSMMSDTILDLIDTNTRTKIEITIAGTSSKNQFLGEGYVTSYKLVTPFDDKVTFEMGFEFTGKPTLQDST